MEELLQVLKKNAKRLRKFRGVFKVDIGYRWTDGKMTGELALRVHVRRKKPESELSYDEIIPESLDGYPVDVIESKIELHRTGRYDPLLGGIEIRNVNLSSTGTLGAVVYDVYSRRPMALSNHHVLVGSRRGMATGDQANQPGTAGDEDSIGTVARSSLVYDAAVINLNGKRKVSISVIDFPGGIKGVTEPVPGMIVTKSGRTTGTTRGMIEGVSEKEFTVVPVPGHMGDEISSCGDSGSVWLEEISHAAVGLHYGGEASCLPEEERAWAKRISGVANVMKIHLCRKTLLHPVSMCGPSVTSRGNRLLLGFTKPGTHRVRFLHSDDGIRFSGRISPGIHSSYPVALTVYRNRFIVAWSELTDGHISLRFSDNGRDWSGKISSGECSFFSPSLAATEDNLFMSWVEPGSGRICLMQSSDGTSWQNKCILDETATSAPAIASYNGKLRVAWNEPGNRLCTMTTVDGSSTAHKQMIDNSSGSQPFLHIHSGRLYLAWSRGSDRRLNIIESADGISYTGRLVLRETSPDRPALATLNDELVWFWQRGTKRPGLGMLTYTV